MTRAILLLGLILTAVPASAIDYYVRVGGSDGNDGLSPATSFASITHAASYLINGGDRVFVGPGMYHEGNLTPRRGGLVGAPIEMIADRGGTRTGDEPGPVVVAPASDRVDQTTGFQIYGKQNLVIDGFTIADAHDAAIQVRPAVRTMVPSANVTVRHVTVERGGGGIEVAAEGEVLIGDNRFEGVSRFGAGIIVAQATNALVEGNTFATEGSQNPSLGIGLDHCRTAIVRNNQIRDMGHAVQASSVDELTVSANRISDNGTGIHLGGDAAVGNARIELNTFARNQWTINGTVDGDVLLRGNDDSSGQEGIVLGVGNRAEIQSNRWSSTLGQFAVSGSEVAMADNSLNGRRLDVRGGSLQLSDNELRGRLLLAGPSAVLTKNQLQDLESVVAHIELEANDVSGSARFDFVDSAAITDNTFHGPFLLAPPHDHSGSAANTAIGGKLVRLSGNQLQQTSIGVEGSLTAFQGLIEVVDNVASDSVQVATEGDVVLQGNRISGAKRLALAAFLAGEDPQVEITDNQIDESAIDGIYIAGAHGGQVSNNQIDGSQGTAITIRRSAGLEISGNTLRFNGEGGIGINTFSRYDGDCNRDSAVTMAEVALLVRILLDDQPVSRCPWLNEDGDDAITVDEVVRAQLALTAAEPLPAVPIDVEQVLSRNTIEDSGKYGIEIFTQQPTRIEDNTVSRSAAVGISVSNDGPGGVVVAGNHVIESKDSAVRVAGGLRAVVAGNTVDASDDNGIHVDAVRSLELTDNQVEHCNHLGIVVANSTDVVCEHNVIEVTGSGGISLSAPVGETMNAVVRSNQIQSVGMDGLLLVGAATAVVDDNSIRSTGGGAIVFRRSSDLTLRNNTIRDSVGAGIEATVGHDLTVNGATIRNCGKSGIHVQGFERVTVSESDLFATLGRVQGVSSEGGLDLRAVGQAVVVGNRIAGSGLNGIRLVHLSRGIVQNNLVFGHGGNGIDVASSGSTQIANNLVYDNAGVGVSIGEYDLDEAPNSSPEAFVVSNTVYRNSGAGLRVAAGSTDAYIEHNILFDNRPSNVDESSLPGLYADFNLNADGYVAPYTPGAHDLDGDPLFVNPAGADGILGGDGYADDDFHLQTGEMASPAIDAGRDTAVAVGLSGVAAQGATADAGLLDLGFHYNASPRLD